MVSSDNMSYARISYDYLLNGVGTSLGGAYSSLYYKLGGYFANLQAHGKADVSSVWIKQTIKRGVVSNIYGNVQFDRKQMNDEVDLTSLHTDRHLNNWTAMLDGDIRDSLFSGGYNLWSLKLTVGNLVFDDAAANQVDASTANTAGSFDKWNFSTARIQRLTDRDSFYLAVSGQWASGNLDSSEKMVGGGPYSVRAFDTGVISGDKGYLGTAELRHQLVQNWMLKAFIDGERIVVNRSPWVAGKNRATLAGAGLGLDWSNGSRYVRIYAAQRMGSVPGLIPNAPAARGWFELGTSF